MLRIIRVVAILTLPMLISCDLQILKKSSERKGAFRLPKIVKNPSQPKKSKSIYNYLLGRFMSDKNKSANAIKIYQDLAANNPKDAHPHYLLAQEYAKVAKTDQAVDSLLKAISMKPKNKEYRIYHANLLVTAKKNGEARVVYEDLLSDFPDDVQLRVYLAVLELEEKNTQKSEKILQEALAIDKNNALVHFYLGRIYQFRGQNKKAVVALKKAIDLRREFVQAGTYLGLLQEQMGDKDGALETYLWLAENTDNGVFHERVGSLYLEKKNYQKALLALQDYERVENRNLTNKLKIALIHIELKELDAAKKKLTNILKEAPDNENIRFYLAAVFEEKKNYEQAVLEYSKIGSDSKLYPDAIRGLLESLHADKKTAEATSRAQLILRGLTPTTNSGERIADILVNFLINTNQLKLARISLEESLLKFTSLRYLEYTSAVLKDKEGDKKGAVKIMKKYLASNKDSSSAQNFIGYLYAELGENLKEAETLIKSALKSKPNDAYIMDSLGWVYYKKGEYQEALKWLKKAFDEKPEEVVILEHLGDVLKKINKKEDARKYYRSALKYESSETEKSRLKTKLVNITPPGMLACVLSGGDNCSLQLDKRKPAAAQSSN